MAEDERELEKHVKAQLLSPPYPDYSPQASPNVAYVKYIIEDLHRPSDLPEDLTNVAYDKEQALSNLDDKQIKWLRMQLMRSVLMYRNGRPALAGNYNEEIKLAVLPAKHMMKLARSKRGFERQQQTTQTIIKQAITSPGGQPAGGRRWRVLGRRKGGGGEGI